MKNAAFPVIKTLDELDRAACSIPGPTLDYLASLEWITAAENLCLVGPAGTGKSHVLVALGAAAVHAGHKVRYFTAADLADTLYRGLADNSAGRIIENLLRNDLILVDEVGFAPLDDTGAQLLFRFVSAAYERRALGIASHWPFDQWGRFLPEHTTAVSLLDRLLHHANVVVTAGDSYRMRQARARGGTALTKKKTTRGMGTFNWPPAGTANWPLTISGTYRLQIQRVRTLGQDHDPGCPSQAASARHVGASALSADFHAGGSGQLQANS